MTCIRTLADLARAAEDLRRLACTVPGLEVLYEERDFRRYQSGQPTVISGAYITTVLQYGYTWPILQLYGRSGPTGTFGNHVLRTKPRAQAGAAHAPGGGQRHAAQTSEERVAAAGEHLVGVRAHAVREGEGDEGDCI